MGHVSNDAITTYHLPTCPDNEVNWSRASEWTRKVNALAPQPTVTGAFECPRGTSVPSCELQERPLAEPFGHTQRRLHSENPSEAPTVHLQSEAPSQAPTVKKMPLLYHGGEQATL